jgi:hypothetical protein
MEAFSTFEDERKRVNRLAGSLEGQINESRRNVVSPDIPILIDRLVRSVEGLRVGLNDAWNRLYGAIGTLRSSAEFIGLTPEILEFGLARPLTDDPTDDLILASILGHAASHPSETKAFVSENRKDFDAKPFARSALEGAGVKYFAQASKFLEWHRSQSESIE